MQSTDLTFPLDYLYDYDDYFFNLLTNDYEFKCDNYAVAYHFLQFLDKLKMCEHSQMTDDCFYPYSWVIFFSCRPQDALRMKYVAKRIPSYIDANVRIYNENEEEI